MPAHYVYEYFYPESNRCFYVGCGKGERYISTADRPPEFKKIIWGLKKQNLSPIIKFVAVNITWEQALKIEVKRIAYHLTNGHRLTNRCFVYNGIRYDRVDMQTWRTKYFILKIRN